jgi:mycoredoxin-dependent peroxiredoxin
MALEVGTEAPDFTLTDDSGEQFTLSSLRGTPVHLNFFPAAFSPVCTGWFTPIADDPSAFEGARVVGVSVDGRRSLEAWKAQLGADHITFCADFHPKGEVATAYGVYLDQAGVAGRATFVIDADGVIVDVHQVAPLETPDADRLITSLSGCAR